MFSRKNFSRRDFLKVLLTSLGGFLASCFPQVEDTEAPATDLPPTDSPPTEPPESEPTEPPVLSDNVPEGGDEGPPAEVSATEEPATEEPFCFQLLTPENEAVLPTVGKVTFSWEPLPGTDKYLLEITLPNGTVVPFETQLTYRDQYIEAITLGGTFTWQVSAFDTSGVLLCTSDAFSFEKPAYEQNKNDSGGGDGNGSGDTTGGGPGSTTSSGSNGEG